ncbi:MAG: hypothetical protein V3V41_09705 [Candidatus Heimdallarchaeota archaeon]
MPFPRTDINPLGAVIVYDLNGEIIFKLEQASSEKEVQQIDNYFIQPIEFYKWVRRYHEITIFRGRFRATYVTFIDVTLLFVSRVENIGAEFRPVILSYISLLGGNVLRTLARNEYSELIEITSKSSYGSNFSAIEREIEKIFARLGIDKPEEILIPAEERIERERKESRIETYEKIRPFESVPRIPASEMTQEILDDANKRAITSLLFSSIRSCDSPAAAAYIFPKEGGTMGELYAGNLEEKKIIYVLETITKFPRVIYEMINSKDEIKALNADVVQIIIEDCSEGRILIGMTTNVNDVINVGYKFKIVKHILRTMGF